MIVEMETIMAYLGPPSPAPLLWWKTQHISVLKMLCMSAEVAMYGEAER
jgi:hypothetical protein